MLAALLLLWAQDPVLDLDARARALSARLEDLRGLNLRSPLTLRPGTRQEYARQALENARRLYGAELGLAEAAFKSLGLVPPKLRLDLALTAQAGLGVKVYALGNEIALLDPHAGDEWILNKMALALEDQHFRPEASPTYDAQMALAALRMGDAEVLKLLHRHGGRIPEDAARQAADEALAWERGDSRLAAALVPRLFVRTAEFPWRRGAAFALDLHARGGLKALDAAWKRPPTTTEQVLHPGKYAAAEAPLEIDPSPLDQVLEPFGRVPAWRSSLGELGAAVILESHFPSDTPPAASEGWAGDTFTSYAGGESPLLTWLTAWDQDLDADEFETQARRLAAKLPSARCARRGRAVLVLVNVPADLLDPILSAAWTCPTRRDGRPGRLDD